MNATDGQGDQQLAPLLNRDCTTSRISWKTTSNCSVLHRCLGHFHALDVLSFSRGAAYVTKLSIGSLGRRSRLICQGIPDLARGIAASDLCRTSELRMLMREYIDFVGLTMKVQEVDGRWIIVVTFPASTPPSHSVNYLLCFTLL